MRQRRDKKSLNLCGKMTQAAAFRHDFIAREPNDRWRRGIRLRAPPPAHHRSPHAARRRGSCGLPDRCRSATAPVEPLARAAATYRSLRGDLPLDLRHGREHRWTEAPCRPATASPMLPVPVGSPSTPFLRLLLALEQTQMPIFEFQDNVVDWLNFN